MAIFKPVKMKIRVFAKFSIISQNTCIASWTVDDILSLYTSHIEQMSEHGLESRPELVACAVQVNVAATYFAKVPIKIPKATTESTPEVPKTSSAK